MRKETSRHPRLVAAEAAHPLREAGLFVAVTFLVAAGVYLPLLAKDLGWIGITLPPGLPVVGILSPGVATLVIHLYDEGVDGVGSVLDGLAAWRFGRVWWGVTLALPPVFVAVYAGAYIGLGHGFSPEPIQMVTEAGVAFVLLILMTVVLAAGEEIGWRGHLLPLLQARLSALMASLVLGVIWAAWHVPVFYGAGIEGWALPLRVIGVFGGAVMYTWLFNSTGGSVLAVTLLHAGFNLWGPLLAPTPTGTPAATVFTGENILLAVVLIVIFGGATLTDRRSLPGR
jgi:membrane protease YdiL (CAAX protease family)